MDLNYTETDLEHVRHINIPDIFYNRLKTGFPEVDRLFGDGMLPGSSFTIAAEPGAGKTTFLLQVLNQLQQNGFQTAYCSGEEAQVQVAYNAKRLKCEDVRVCYKTSIDSILELIRDNDIVVIDSFTSVKPNRAIQKLSRNQRQIELINLIVSAAKKFETVVGVVLHVTKSGTYKGVTDIAHAVDCNMQVSIGNEDDIRVLETSKNRWGPTYRIQTEFGLCGYNFDNFTRVDNQAQSKQSRAQERGQRVLDYLEANPNATAADIQRDLNFEYAQLYGAIRELGNSIQKTGRGAEAQFSIVE